MKFTIEERVNKFLEKGVELKEGTLPEGLGFNQFIEQIQTRLSEVFDNIEKHLYTWVEEVYDDGRFVYRLDGKFFEAAYAVVEGQVQLNLSQAREVARKVMYEEDRKPLSECHIMENRKLGALFEGAEFDKEALTIRNVSILGAESANERDYSEAAMREAATLLNGAKQYLNHTVSEDDQRDVRNLFSRLENVRFNAQEMKVRGDMHLVDSRSVREEILPIIEHFKDQIGNSISAYGEFIEQETGRDLVTHITKVESADLVTDPATNAGLFESINSSKNKKGGEFNMKFTLEHLEGIQKSPELMAALTESIKTQLASEGEHESVVQERDSLREQLKEAKVKIDVYEAKEAEEEKKKQVATIISESKLPKSDEAGHDIWVAQEWVELVESCNTEVEVRKMVTDKEKIYLETQKKVVEFPEHDPDKIFEQARTKETKDQVDPNSVAEFADRAW